MDATRLADPVVDRLLDDRYHVLEPLARGGMATVYHAVDVRLDRSVAVKVMHPALAEDADFVARFQREAKAAARIASPYVVSVTDAGEDGGVVFLVMELVRGRTLRSILRERGRLSPSEALEVLEPVAGALAAAHAAGLVHRDVKPENVLLADDGQVKVADFGLARAIAASPLTAQAGLLLGTVAYLAPEQVSSGGADERSDVYAAGVMLYELLTGLPPFEGDTPLAVAYRHVHERVPPPSQSARGIPGVVDDLVLTMTAREPERRPADGRALATLVRRVRHQLATAAAGGRDTRVVSLVDAPTGVVELDAAAASSASASAAAASATAATSALGASALAAGAPTTNLDALAVATAPLPARPEAAPAGGGGGTPPRRRWLGAGPRGVRRRRRLVVLVVLLVLSGAAAALGWWFGSGRYVAVPSLRGDSVTTAEQLLGQHHLQARTGSGVHSDTVQVGLVALTSPSAAGRLPRGSTVTLHRSLGPLMETVPTLRHDQPSVAETALRDTLLTGRVSYAYSSTTAAGEVVSTAPAAGQRVRHGTRVTLVVSKGFAPVHVPAVRNEPASTAAAALEHAGLHLSESQAYSTRVVAGDVVSQSVAAGTSVVHGSTVDLVVSKGPQYVTVPSVIGDSTAQAVARLDALGLVVRQDRFPGTSGGTVVYQQPSGGQVQVGSTVTIATF